MLNPKNIVYYSGFWYSSHSPIGDNEYNLLFNQKDNLQRITYDIRLLSLIFDVIHVPRSHFLTFQTSSHWEIVKKYLSSDDFNYFKENEVLLSSTLPYLDDYGDTERILERIKENKWSEKVDNNFLKIIKDLSSAKIDSGREARNNVDEFENYISLIGLKNKKLGKTLSDIKKKSTYKFIPFLHEIFIEEILKSDKLTDTEKINIWRKTNSIYITTGGLDLGDDRRISLDNKIEDFGAKNDNSGLLRELYSPKFIQALFVDELGEKNLIRFLNGDIDKVMSFRELEIWQQFKFEIFEMFKTMSLLEKIKPEEFALYTNERKVLEYKKFVMKEDNSGIAGIFADLLVIASEVIDPITGKVFSTGKKIIADKLVKTYSDSQLSKKMKSYKPFWKKFKESLEKVSY